MKNSFPVPCLLFVLWFCFFPAVGVSAEFKITASSSGGDSYAPENIIDDDMQTRWTSKFSDRQWLIIDFGEAKEISGLTLYWETAYAVSYEVLVSLDEADWKTVYIQNQGKGGNEDAYFDKVKARYVKLLFKKRATEWGYSLWEISIEGADPSNLDKVDVGEIIPLGGKWNFRIDTNNLGVKEKWFSPGNISKDWAEIEMGKFWEEQGFSDYDGYAWYKKEIVIPESWDDGKAAILFGGVDDAYELYVNGRYVSSFGSMDSESESVHQTITTSLIGKYLIPGKPNCFVLRVFDFWGSGGVARGPMILVQKADAVKGLTRRLDAQSYYQKKARGAQKKFYPQWVGSSQAYWTVVGVEGDKMESTFCEDGMIQMYNRGPSLMPFIYLNDELLSAADFKVSQSLEKDYLPIPTVVWDSKDLVLYQKLFAYGKAGESFSCIRYTLKNKGTKTLKGKLFLAIRPFQVNPSWQWGGGMASIKDLEYYLEKKPIIKIDGQARLIALKPPKKFGALKYLEGDIVDKIKTATTAGARSVNDPLGYASGALEYNFKLRPGGQEEYFFVIPLHRDKAGLTKILNSKAVEKNFEKMEEETGRYWKEKLSRVQIEIPDKEMSDAIKSSIAYILINKDGPMIQAGSGAYEKSWIRDGSLTSSVLLKMGYVEEVREYVDWLSKQVKTNGKVPPIMITENNPEPAWENVFEEYDSQGQYIYTVLQYYLFTKDKQWLQDKLPTVIRVLDFMENLRKKRMTDEYKNGPPEKRKFYGIFPESVSHEGYFPAPGVHSYWDDFWGIKGWKDARAIAQVLQENDLLVRTEREIEDFKRCLYDSIKAVQEEKNINYIPASVEKADFDAPSTAIAVLLAGETEDLPKESLDNTFKKFWSEQFLPSLKAGPNWSFSPYALRIAEVFIFLNQKDKAIRMLEQYMKLRRPLAWNQWAEGILGDDRRPWFVGDLPHTWVASIFVNSFRSLFVYEKEGQLILAHGIPQKWISEKEGLAIKGFPTYYGDINYTLKQGEKGLELNVWGTANPPKGFIFKSPISDKEFTFSELPANIVVD